MILAVYPSAVHATSAVTLLKAFALIWMASISVEIKPMRYL